MSLHEVREFVKTEDGGLKESAAIHKNRDFFFMKIAIQNNFFCRRINHKFSVVCEVVCAVYIHITAYRELMINLSKKSLA